MPIIYRPGVGIKEKVATLTAAIENRLPFCSGTVPVAKNDLMLYYAKQTGEKGEGSLTAGCLDLTNSTEDELKRLTDICDPATFGLNREDVLDLSYRKAWKLEPAHFSSKLNLLHAGVMESIQYNLLEKKRKFYADLYKLNIYAKGGFFKPHKDTPRSQKMFGSLVVVLPTPHEGGTLVLRKNGEEWRFDPDRTNPSSIYYIAFFGDVEHEVLEVTSGHRLTLTYNLYFGESLDSQAVLSIPDWTSSALITSLPSNAAKFQSVLSGLLADPTFLPFGGLLGFGLAHEYPVDGSDIDLLWESLKGSDAAIAQSCRALGVHCSLKVCYVDDYEQDGRAVLCNSAVDLGGEFLDTTFFYEVRSYKGSLVVNTDKWDYGNEEKIYLKSQPSLGAFVHWVTNTTTNNITKTEHVAHGNEPQLEYDYGHICLIVDVGPAGERDKKRKLPEDESDDGEDGEDSEVE